MKEAAAGPARGAARVGRPRSFDRAAALDAALDLFWARGYAGVELRDLTAAMGIHPPSFYAAFGTKERLFLEAVDRYEDVYVRRVSDALDAAPRARAAVEALFRLSVETFTRPGGPHGCLLATGAVNCTPAQSGIAEELARRRTRAADTIRRRLERGQMEGDVPASADTLVLTAFVGAFAAGLSLQARDGVARTVLESAANTAARVIPQEA